MIVTLLNQILERYPLNREHGIIVQFVTHKKASFWSEEVYDDAVHVTPIAHDGEVLHYRSRYFHCNQLKDWEKRDAFRKLVKMYNVANFEKGEPFTQIHLTENYCTIQ